MDIARLTGRAAASPGIIIPCFASRGITAPCFLVGPGRIVLPAFSSNAAGCDVVSAAAPEGVARRFPALPGQHGRRGARFWTTHRSAAPAASPSIVDLALRPRDHSAS